MRSRNQTKRRPATTGQTIVIRPAYADDALVVHRLAVLDSAPIPPAPLLLGEVDGEPRAAVSLKDGSVVADPFFPTIHLVELLCSHASADDHARQPRRSHRFRLVPRLA